MTRWAAYPWFALGALVAALALVPADPAFAGKPKLKGRIDKGVYTSGAKLFRVSVPPSRNWAGVPFTISDASETKADRFDMVLFDVKDFGEMLTACARPMPPEVAARYAKAESPMEPLARAALHTWDHLPPELTLLSDSSLADSTSRLLLYRAPKGSLLAQSTGGEAPERFDAIVAVAVTVRKGVFLYAIGQSDMGVMNPDEAVNIADLKEAMRTFFGSLTLLE